MAQHLIPFVLAAGGLATGIITVLSVTALLRRRSWSYLLVTLALAFMLGKTLLGALTVTGLMAEHSHHFWEHGFDVLTVGLLISAVYAARTVERPAVEQSR